METRYQWSEWDVELCIITWLNRFAPILSFCSVEFKKARELQTEEINCLFNITLQNMKELCIQNGYDWDDESERIPT